MSDDWWATPAGVQTALREEIKIRNDRIEELEADLAKAMLALEEAIYLLDPDDEDIAKETGLHRIVTTYRELKGQDDE